MTIEIYGPTSSAPVERWAHIHVAPGGVAWIDKTSAKVVEVALAHRAWGWSAELIHDNLPHLSRAQIHAALAYYFDHLDSLDRQIEEDLRRVDDLAVRHPPEATRQALRLRLRAP